MTLPARPRWYDHLPEVAATVDCEGSQHRVGWRRGKLVLEAHDLAAERTMEVLGGEPCVCMRVLRLWREQFGMPPELFSRLEAWLGPEAYLAPPEFAVVRRLAMVQGWERQWRRTLHQSRKHEQLLAAELKTRATPPFRQHLTAWKERAGARVVGAAVVKLVRTDHAPAIEGRLDAVSVRATASLPPQWMTDVLVKGVAVVGDAFVLAVTGAPSRRELRVRAVRWEPGAGGVRSPVDAPATLSYRGTSWQLAWDDAAPPR